MRPMNKPNGNAQPPHDWSGTPFAIAQGAMQRGPAPGHGWNRPDFPGQGNAYGRTGMQPGGPPAGVQPPMGQPPAMPPPAPGGQPPMGPPPGGQPPMMGQHPFMNPQMQQHFGNLPPWVMQMLQQRFQGRM
jgi:hypothetical protein